MSTSNNLQPSILHTYTPYPDGYRGHTRHKSEIMQAFGSDCVILNTRNVSREILAAYIDQASPSTPTCDKPARRAMFALAKGITLLMLRPFAAIAAFFISSRLDPANSRFIVKMGRYLEIPRIYSNLAFAEFAGFIKREKADVILAQQFGAFVWTQITADHIQEYVDKMTVRYNVFSNPLSLPVREKLRLGEIRNLTFKTHDFVAGRESLTFQHLIDQGYLVPKAKS